MAKIAEKCRIPYFVQQSDETEPPDLAALSETLMGDPSITHVAVVHCETTTGMLNPVQDIGKIVKSADCVYIVDAMSSFGGITMDLADIQADYMISSANKCIQGVPGFGFIIVKKNILTQCAGFARTLSLDIYDQWETMEQHSGKWRFTSPTHTVRAFAQALAELKAEGGISARHSRYMKNHAILVAGMRSLGFETLLPDDLQSPIITAFHSPTDPAYEFAEFYRKLKEQQFVIYPGKVTDVDTFRIGNIGDIHPPDMNRLIKAVQASMYWTPKRELSGKNN
jgi:2-aminoethylphosphonate-pyruvate transaminase